MEISLYDEKLMKKWLNGNKPKVKMNYCNDINVNRESPRGYSKTQVWNLLVQGVCKKANKDQLNEAIKQREVR
jgi:hypothetical protein